MSSLLRRICVYLGEGADEKNAAVILAALKQHLHGKNVNLGYISPQETIEGTWRKSTSLYVIGGGYDLGFISALGPSGTKQIHDYVVEGGSYLGLCAGAYFASDYIEFDKNGPLEVCGERNLKFYPGLCVGPVYGPYNYITEMGARPAKFKFDEQSHNLSESEKEPSTKCSEFKCYFNGGGMFLPYNKGKPIIEKVYEERNNEDKRNMENRLELNKLTSDSSVMINEKEDEVTLKAKENIENPYVLNVTFQNDEEWYKKGDNSVTVQILASYQEITGNPACIVKSEVGKGTAVLSGPHIEYNSCSINDDNVYLKYVKDEICSYDNDQNLCFSQLLKHLGLL